MKIELSIGLTPNLRTQPVIDGQVTADAIDLIPTAIHPSELFWRQEATTVLWPRALDMRPYSWRP